MAGPAEKEPAPTRNDSAHVQPQVIEDVQRIYSNDDVKALVEALEARYQLGMQKYGTGLQPGNGRDVLNDSLQEAIDLVNYLKQGVLEEKLPEWLYLDALRIVVDLTLLNVELPKA
jgi:hypothetical protein